MFSSHTFANLPLPSHVSRNFPDVRTSKRVIKILPGRGSAHFPPTKDAKDGSNSQSPLERSSCFTHNEGTPPPTVFDFSSLPLWPVPLFRVPDLYSDRLISFRYLWPSPILWHCSILLFSPSFMAESIKLTLNSFSLPFDLPQLSVLCGHMRQTGRTWCPCLMHLTYLKI